MIPKPHIVPGGVVYVDAYATPYNPKDKSNFAGSPVAGKLEALDASVTLAIDGVSSSATLRLPKGTKIANRTYIEMYTVQGSAGVFRARSPQIGYGEFTTVQLEHAINELGDYIITDKIEEKTTLKKAVKKIFDYYSKKSSLWSKGDIDEPKDPDSSDEDSSVECVLEADYDNCLDVLNSVMEQYPYMMFTFDFSTTPWKLNIVNKPTTVQAEGRLSRNIKSAVVTRDDSEMANKVYMEGYKKNVDSNGYGSRSSKYSIDKYGLIETVISGNEKDKDISELTIKSYLRKHKKPSYSISINGIELSEMTGEKLDRLTLGKLMRIALPDYGETITENITGLSFPSVYKTPNAVTVTLNDEPDKVIKYIKKAQKTASRAGGAARKISKEAIVKAEVSSDGKQVTLTYGDGRQVVFSKAVTLYNDSNHNAGWSNGVYWVRAYTRMNVGGTNAESELASISTTLNGVFVQDGKQPQAETPTSDQLIVPVKVTYLHWGGAGDTGFHKDDFKVDARPVYNNGWGAAYDKVVYPGSGSSYLFSFKAPDSVVGSQKSTFYAIRDADNNNVKVENPDGQAVATYTHGKYNAGWGDAFGKVIPAPANQSTNSLTVKTPSATVGQDQSLSYNIRSKDGDDNAVEVYSTSSMNVVAVLTHNKYKAGFSDGQDATIIKDPTWSGSLTSPTATFKTNADHPAQSNGYKLHLYSQVGNWSSGSCKVTVTHTDSTSGNKIIERTVSVDNNNVDGSASTSLSGSGLSIGSLSAANLTQGRYINLSLTICGKAFSRYISIGA